MKVHLARQFLSQARAVTVCGKTLSTIKHWVNSKPADFEHFEIKYHCAVCWSKSRQEAKCLNA